METYKWTHYSQWKEESSQIYSQGEKKHLNLYFTPWEGFEGLSCQNPRKKEHTVNMNRTGKGFSEHAGAKFCVERIILDELKLEEVAQRQTEIQSPSVKQKICDSIR